jgi:hypothetical protein
VFRIQRLVVLENRVLRRMFEIGRRDDWMAEKLAC